MHITRLSSIRSDQRRLPDYKSLALLGKKEKPVAEDEVEVKVDIGEVG